jgi:hypothetical protein
MKAIFKSSTLLISLAVMLHTPMALAKPPEGSRSYENTVGTGAYHSPNFVSAVPEADTYAMMLAGLGLVGFMVYRRHS